MKAINSNIWKRILFLALGFTALASCSEDAMDRVNEDNDHTTSAPAKFVLADVITSTAFSNVGGDLNTYFSAYTEHTVGVDNQLYNAEIRNGEPSVASTFNNVWENLYSTLKNARIVILTASDEVAANYTTRGMAEVLAAINGALITDAFGNTPYSQAALPQLKDGKPQYMAPNVDTQEAIYQAIMKSLDDAIVDLPKGDAKDKVGSYDFIYKGDGAKWIKLAYGLKARYTMRLLARSKNREADLQKVLEYVDKSFKSIDDQAAYAIYDATTSTRSSASSGAVTDWPPARAIATSSSSVKTRACAASSASGRTTCRKARSASRYRSRAPMIRPSSWPRMAPPPRSSITTTCPSSSTLRSAPHC